MCNDVNADIKELVGRISKKNFMIESNSKNFAYIKRIWFPFYKNFERYSEIDFSFPLTVLVGKNGSGKSSILHALYGCIKKKNLGQYWFSTKVDPIEDGDGENRHCFVYSYTINDEERQVSYQRASRPGTKTKRKNPDYWETAGYVRKYKMDRNLSLIDPNSNKRMEPIDCNLIYIDFREVLSAFDKYFYFGDLKKTKSHSKQDFIRRKSSSLAKVLNGEDLEKTKGVPQYEKAVILTEEELKCISNILGNTYTSGKIIKHHFFQNWGYSVVLTRSTLSYTEAHAGSGEFAVVMLVHKILSEIKDNHKSTLILLDEPETSLYPGAQKRLLRFLLRMVLGFKCQIVLSTHSEKLISGLPSDAIKAIHYDENTATSTIRNHCLTGDVFEELELPHKKINIYVEDRASKILISKVAELEKINEFNIEYIDGGADTLKNTHIFSSSQQKDYSTFYILDGDQYVNLEKVNIQDEEEVNNIVNKICSSAPFSSSKGKNHKTNKDLRKIESQREYLDYFKRNVYYLPGAMPESILLKNSEYLQPIVDSYHLNYKIKDKCNSDERPKNIIYSLIKEMVGNEFDENDYYGNLKSLVNLWAKERNEDYVKIANILKSILKKEGGKK